MDARTEVKLIFIDSRPIDMSNGWEKPCEKWKSRPDRVL